MLEDLKYGLRMYIKTPGSSFASILTIAIGLGASIAVFSVVNAVLLKPLPYTDSERIVIPWRLVPLELNVSYSEIAWNMQSFKLFLRESTVFQNLGAFKSDSFNLTGSGDPALLEGIRASAGFFPALGVAPTLGRTFAPDEDRIGHERVVILSHQLWRERFSGDQEILGRTVYLNGDAYTVVGVMPPGFMFPRGEEMPGRFNFPNEAQIWVPLALPEARPPDSVDDLVIIGRLKPGIKIDQAKQEMDAFAATQEKEFPRSKGWFNSRVTPLERQVAGDTRLPLLLMLGAVGVVLLIACSNVANLLLARSLNRRREFTLRVALGAGRGRLMRQLLTESLLLAGAGGVVGILLAQAGIYLVKIFGPSNIPRLREVNLDMRVAAFALAITLITGILFGLVPAIGVGGENLAESLKEGGQRSVGRSTGGKIRKGLIVLEVALALVLAVAAGLLSRTFLSLLNTDGGFNADHVLTFELSLPAAKYADTNRIVTLYQRALQSFQTLPGVESAGIVYTVPMGGATEGSLIRIPDHPTSNDPDKRPFANYTIASPGYFSAVRTPLLRGRDFLESDTVDSVPVVIINNTMAKRFWPGEEPIGKQVGLASLRFPLMTIIGIVMDTKHLSLRESPGPEMYVPYTQKLYPSMLRMHVVLRSLEDTASLTANVREAIDTLDPDLPMAKVTTLPTLVDNSLAQPRFSMLLLTTFGGIALLLACTGIYGVISYSVAQRTQEIGIRLAVGAQPWQVLRMILSQGARLTGLGIVIGLLVALGVTRLMASFLYGVQAIDPVTFAGVALLLVVVALLACYVPARRAARIDPIIALRYE
ncbi:MAG: ABC transporter permease [Blastocatellia bacterium]